MKTLNPYTIKWAVIAPFKSFNKNYESALRKAGFSPCGNGLWADHFNSNSEVSVARIKNQIAKLYKKFESYKHRKAVFSFVITDKQFGLIGTERAKLLSSKRGWVSLPVGEGRVLALTYNQMYAHGAINLPGSQAHGIWGKTFDNSDFKRVW